MEKRVNSPQLQVLDLLINLMGPENGRKGECWQNSPRWGRQWMKRRRMVAKSRGEVKVYQIIISRRIKQTDRKKGGTGPEWVVGGPAWRASFVHKQTKQYGRSTWICAPAVKCKRLNASFPFPGPYSPHQNLTKLNHSSLRFLWPPFFWYPIL